MNGVRMLPQAFDPRICATDALTARWLAEATLRLRREVAWMWFQRAGLRGIDDRLPPSADPVVDALDLARHVDGKRHFFENDVTVRYLGDRIADLRATTAHSAGPWAAMTDRLQLDDDAQLVFALGLLARADAASATIIGACQGDLNRHLPTLALAQRLCDDPTAMLTVDTAHPLFQTGLLGFTGDGGGHWGQSYEVPALVARVCVLDDGTMPADLGIPDADPSSHLPDGLDAAALSIATAPIDAVFVPVLGDRGTHYPGVAAALATASGRRIVLLRRPTLPDADRLVALAAWCWLHDVDLMLPELPVANDEHARAFSWPSVPIRWLVPMSDLGATRRLPAHAVQAPVVLPPTDHAARVARLTHALGVRAAGLEDGIAEAARRYRVSAQATEAVGRACALDEHALTAESLQQVFRTQARPDLGSLAQPVQTRFSLSELVLPAEQRRQLAEIVGATRALTTVHYGWGTARAWNESGLSALFCGPPGTGKTMAAEAIACELNLPMYRIDLSQVVNKCIGETEKNLKRVFDAIEESDCVLFFDEADALFGKRTNVKDAHDRFANIEISYLLERMERLKGVAILATNRRRDLDEAFLRRLRYLVDFPLPDEAERECLWRYMFPSAVDTSSLDIPFLAKSFVLAGGHIRSIAFNACLQSAASGVPRVGMQAVLCAVKREFDKLNRPISIESFGRHRDLVQMLFDEVTS